MAEAGRGSRASLRYLEEQWASAFDGLERQSNGSAVAVGIASPGGSFKGGPAGAESEMRSTSL